MNKLIEQGLIKVKTIAKGKDVNLEKEMDFLLNSSVEEKILFLQNPSNYTSKENAIRIGDLMLFENDEKIKIKLGENANKIDNLCMEHLENINLRRQLNVILKDSSVLYTKALRQEKSIEAGRDI